MADKPQRKWESELFEACVEDMTELLSKHKLNVLLSIEADVLSRRVMTWLVNRMKIQVQ